MRIGFITTGTNDTDHVIDSACCIPEFKSVCRITHNPRTREPVLNPSLIKWALDCRLDVCFYIGAASGYNPRIEQFLEIKAKIPLYHICFDAGDKPWWPLLMEYKRANCFVKQITIDGARETPCDMAALTPINPDKFNWQQKKIHRLGFCGSVGSLQRKRIVNGLIAEKILTFKNRDKTNHTHESYNNFMSQCQTVLNMSWTGSGETHHVKGRVLEAIYSGARLMEDYSSPTKFYFEENIDYLTHNGTVGGIIDMLKNNNHFFPTHTREKAIDLYGPRAFYKLILGDLLP